MRVRDATLIDDKSVWRDLTAAYEFVQEIEGTFASDSRNGHSVPHDLTLDSISPQSALAAQAHIATDMLTLFPVLEDAHVASQ